METTVFQNAKLRLLSLAWEGPLTWALNRPPFGVQWASLGPSIAFPLCTQWASLGPEWLFPRAFLGHSLGPLMGLSLVPSWAVCFTFQNDENQACSLSAFTAVLQPGNYAAMEAAGCAPSRVAGQGCFGSKTLPKPPEINECELPEA